MEPRHTADLIHLSPVPPPVWTEDFIPAGPLFTDDPAAILEIDVWPGVTPTIPYFAAQLMG